MLAVSLASADAVLLVYSVADLATFEAAARLRDLVVQARGPDLPLVVVGNKTDLEREISQEEAEAVVCCDWENSYIECCAAQNSGIPEVFRAVLAATRSGLVPSNPGTSVGSMVRRQSLPQVPVFSRLLVTQQPCRSYYSPTRRRKSSCAMQ